MPTQLKDARPLRFTVEQAAASLLFIALVFVLARMFLFHVHMIVYPYQTEYREGADLLLTTAFAQGIDPYAPANQPQYANAYGFVSNLLAAPFVAYFGPSFAYGRALSALSVLLSCLLLIAVLRRLRVSILLCLVAAVLLDASLITDGYTVLARADGLGLLLFLASLCVPVLGRYSTRSLIVSLICALLAFHTKLYFVLGGGYLAAFLFLFVSKRMGIAYGLTLIVLLIVSALLLDQRADFYFSNAVFAHINAASDDGGWAWQQIRRTFAFFGWLWLAFLVASVASLWMSFPSRPVIVLRLKAFYANLRSRVRLDIVHASLPLIRGGNTPLALFGFVLAVSLALLYLKLNHNEGAGTTYDYQLAGPFMVLLAVVLLARLRRVQAVVSLLLIPVVLLTGQHQFAVLAHGPDASPDWARLADVIAAGHNVLNSPPATGLLIENGLHVYDSGSSEYFIDGYNPRHDVKAHYADYKASISALIRQRRFDLIMVTPSLMRFADKDEIALYYRRLETLTLPMPYTLQFWRGYSGGPQSWPTELWVPRDD